MGTTLEEQVAREQADHEAEEAAKDEAAIGGEDAEKGKLFEAPRVKVVVDETDPNVLKLAFSGSIELNRAVPADVEFYNSLAAGRDVDLSVQAFVVGPKTTHRRDSDGNVDSVVQTKSLKVHSVDV